MADDLRRPYGLLPVHSIRKAKMTVARKTGVELMRGPIQNHTVVDESIYDPFMGSGTSIIAAETCGRICCGMEIVPGYVDVAVKRWQDFTGNAALLHGDG